MSTKVPTLEEIQWKLNGATCFSKMDAKTGYWSIKLDEESQPITTFRTPYGRYCYKRLPFGLSISQDIFQERMDSILEKCEGVIGITDDIIVFGSTEEEHNKNLLNLFKVAKNNGLVFNSKKCIIKTGEVSFFGSTYSASGISPDPKKVEDLNKMPTPTCRKELSEFMGLINYLSPFINNLADKSAPLRDLLKKNIPFQWDQDHQHVYEYLKSLVSVNTTLKFYDPKAPVQVQVDASTKGLGASILQPRKDKKGNYTKEFIPVAMASKTLTPTETRYANLEREMLAICFGIKRFHTYLYGRDFSVTTDHKPLEMIVKKPLSAAPPRLQRMLLEIQGYNYDITHKPGKDIGLADALSRLPNPENSQEIKLDVRIELVQFKTSKLEEIREKTSEDPVLRELVEIITHGWPKDQRELPTKIRSFWSYRDELSVENGIILKGSRVFIPEPLREEFLKKLHTGHLGIVKTGLRARRDVFWPKIQQEITEMCKACVICDEFKPAQTKETLQPHEIPSRPWQILGTDLFDLQNEQYLIIADYLSKFVVIEKLPKPAPSSVIIEKTKNILCRFGIPKRIMRDNGPHYSSGQFKQFVTEWGIDHVTSSPTFPQSNGFIERQVRTVKQVMMKTLKANEDVYLALLRLNTNPVDTGIPSPAEILYNRCIGDTIPSYSKQDCEEIAEQLKQRQNKQKEYHDRGAKDLPPLIQGSKVTVRNHKTGKWEPATVKSKTDDKRSYIVTNDNTNTDLRRNRVHIRETGQPKPLSHVPKPKPEETYSTKHQPLPKSEDVTKQDKPATTKITTRSGREVKTPAKYKD